MNITIRAVPDDVRNEPAAPAARAGRSLQEYLSAQLADIVVDAVSGATPTRFGPVSP